MRIVVFPIRDRGSSDGRLVDVRSLHHRERCHVATKRPPRDADSIQIHFRMPLAKKLQTSHLILDWNRAELAMDRPLPVAAAPGRAAILDGNHDEPLVREPLWDEPVAHRLRDMQMVRTAV